MKYKLYYCDCKENLNRFLQNYTTFNELDYCDFSGDTHDIIFKDDGMVRYNNIDHNNKNILWYERSFSYWSYYAIVLENNKMYIIKNIDNQRKENLKEFKMIIDEANAEVDEYVSLDSIVF